MHVRKIQITIICVWYIYVYRDQIATDKCLLHWYCCNLRSDHDRLLPCSPSVPGVADFNFT